MDALVLCGGRGSRLGGPTEKPLVTVAGEAMLDRVRRALAAADRVDRVGLATSPLAPRTSRHVATTARPHEHVVDTPGEGYVADLGRALRDAAVGAPVLTVVADLPLLAADAVDRVVGAYRALAGADTDEPGGGPALTVCVPAALKRALDVSADTTRAHGGRELSPTGLNVVGSIRRDGGSDGGDPDSENGTATHDERLHVTHDARLAVNVNRPPDVSVAERLAGGSAPAAPDDRLGGDG